MGSIEYNERKIRINNGYYEIYYPEHPNARKNGSVLLHILIASKMLGRPLTDEETVHHIDSNRKNNDESNLMIFATQADHARYHHMLKNTKDYVLYEKDGIFRCDNTNTSVVCPICGKIKKNMYSRMCIECSNLQRRVISRPEKQQLEYDIKNMSILGIGRKYSVSDNAVRKWLKFYKLPYKKLDILKYIENN